MAQVRLLKGGWRFLAWWPMEASWLGGQWKILGLVANERRRKRFLSTSPHFPLKHLLQLPFFILDIEVLLCPSPRPLFMPSLCFLWPINYDCTSWCHTLPYFIVALIWLKISFFPFLPCNYGVAYNHVPRAVNRTSEWRTASGVVSRSYLDITSSWWRTWTSRGASSSWSGAPPSLVLSHFFELPHPGDLAAGRPRFWWWTRDRLWRLLRNQRYLYLRMVFSPRRWSLPLVTRSDSSTTSQ